MKALPQDVSAYRRTPEFSEESTPEGLRRRHTTKAGVWGHIQVLEGELRYCILEPEPEVHVLRPGSPGVVEPEVPHYVEPLGPVRFYVEFHRRG